MIRKSLLAVFCLLAAVAFLAFATMFYQGRMAQPVAGEYVALGSSFAAGPGLGSRQARSPFVCFRSTGGYPRRVASATGLSLSNMSCSGSTTGHILHGGQAFQGPQLDAIGPQTKLVTITSGGNDVNYIQDMAVSTRSGRLLAWAMSWKAVPLEKRDFAKVGDNLRRIVAEIRRRAPAAEIMIVSYPPVMPRQGTCGAVGLDREATELSRQVGKRLLDATREAAGRSGAIFVDMDLKGEGHDACSTSPWIHGASPAQGTAFHPTEAGAAAVAAAVVDALPSHLAIKNGR